jgi:PPOX class probable F420-dependent enzyme
MTAQKVPLSADVVALLGKPAIAVFGTLLPDGGPQATVAGFVVDGDQLVTHTGIGVQRVKNLRIDPRINVLVVDPDNPLRYVEVRGIAELRECTAADIGPLFKAQAEKYGLPEHVGQVREGTRVTQIQITPTKVNYQAFEPVRMGPQSRQGGKPG